MNNSTSTPGVDSEALLSQLALEFLRQQKQRERRRKFVWILFVALSLWGCYLFFSYRSDSVENGNISHVGLIDVKGAIFENEAASAENFTKSMNKAYASKGLSALILRIDSPGGSPVQASYMYNTIQYYRKKYEKIKIYAVCVDSCASAAYYVAAASDEIYADPASIVGSIGVLFNGFGFVDTMHKLGVTRRLQTAGRNKGFMDQFSPTTPAQEKLLQTMLDLIHQEFIQKVKAGRGKRLLVDVDTFSGLFWTGIQAKQRGLIDGFSSSGQLAREVIKIERIVDYSYKESTFERMAKHIGIAMVNELPEAMGFKTGFQ